MLSLTCKTAIRAVIYIASCELTGIQETADNIGASVHSVGKILQTLVHKGIIKSVKGPGGGFYITTEQLRRPVLDIIAAIDGESMLKQCTLGLNECSSAKPCPLHHEYRNIKQAYIKLCKSKKIRDLEQTVTYGKSRLFI